MIPKIIHYCWFGRNEKNAFVKKCIDSWKQKCPDYIIKEWNEDNFNIEINDYVKEAYSEKKWAFVTDYARLWIIYNTGGFYLDTDVELIKPLDELTYNHVYFGIEDEKLINTGLGFGAEKNNRVIKRMLDDYENLHFKNKNGEIDYTTCVLRNSACIQDILNKIEDNRIVSTIDGVSIYPSEYFCPYDYKTSKIELTKNTISIHWCKASWQSKKNRIFVKIKLILKKIVGNKLYKYIKKFLKGKTNNNE